MQARYGSRSGTGHDSTPSHWVCLKPPGLPGRCPSMRFSVGKIPGTRPRRPLTRYARSGGWPVRGGRGCPEPADGVAAHAWSRRIRLTRSKRRSRVEPAGWGRRVPGYRQGGRCNGRGQAPAAPDGRAAAAGAAGHGSVPVIGWLFLLQVIAGFAVAAVVLATRSGLAAAAGAAFALSTLGGCLLSVWTGLFGFKEVRATEGSGKWSSPALVRLGCSRTGRLRSQRSGRSMPDGASCSSTAETSGPDRSGWRPAVHDLPRHQRHDRGARPRRVRWIEP